MQVKIDLDDDEFQRLFVEVMKDDRDTMTMDMEDRRQGKGIAVFDVNEARDILEMNKHIEAFNLIIEYYGGKEK